jgi:hypothetical protein
MGKHGGRSRLARLVIAIGALMLVTSGIAFALGVHLSSSPIQKTKTGQPASSVESGTPAPQGRPTRSSRRNSAPETNRAVVYKAGEEAAAKKKAEEEAATKKHEEEAAAAKRHQEEVAAATAKTPGAGTPVSVAAPPPKLAVSANLATVSGSVLVKLPGSSAFVALTTVHEIPFGTVVDATHGRVRVTTASPHGGTQTAEYFGGEFVLTQGRNGLVVATLTGGNFSVCPTARERSHMALASSRHTSGKHVVRKLWTDAHGSFSTKGNYAAATVRGTEWLTEDLCEGTLIRVTRDRVTVTNLVNHRHNTLKAGHRYLSKAP